MTAPFVMKNFIGEIITEKTLIFRNVSKSLGDHITFNKFRKWVREGNINDGDGFGRLATIDSKSNVVIMPSDLEGSNQFPEWATHVVWFNK